MGKMKTETMTRLVLMAALITGTLMAAEPLRFESRHIERKIGCVHAKDGCARAEFTYIEAVSGPAIVRKRINTGIRGYLAAYDGFKLNTPEESVKAFVANYEQFRSEEKNSDQTWSLFKSVKALRATPPVISLECSDWSDTGGAHGNGDTLYLNFDARTGASVPLSSILKDGSLPRLTAIAEMYFRKIRKLTPTESLTEAGFDFPGDRFQLNNNFGVSEKELFFHFDTYEVGPRTTGETTIAIPLAEIRDLLRPEFLR